MREFKEFSGLKKPVWGTWLQITDPFIIELAKVAGFNFVCIDNEYIPYDPDKLAQMIRTANNIGIYIIVRVQSLEHISMLINFGADAIMVPDCTFERAKQAVKIIKYAPIGQRSMFGFARPCFMTGLNFNDYYKRANDSTAIVVQIEGQEGMDDLDKILSLEGVDLVCTGRHDISQSLGVPCEYNHPKVNEFEDIVIKKTLAHGKIPIIGGGTTEKKSRKELMEKGVRMLIASRDITYLLNGMKAMMKELMTD